MEKAKEVLDSLKNKKLRFNKKPWKKTVNPVTSTNINVDNSSFVDLHMKVAERVDLLVNNIEQDVQRDKKTVFQN
jgi:hypothetical protein